MKCAFSLVLLAALGAATLLGSGDLTYEELMSMTANELVGMQLTSVITVLDAICEPLTDIIDPIPTDVSVENLNFRYLRACGGNISRNVLAAGELLSELDTKKVTWFHFHGYSNDVETTRDIAALWQQLACRTNEYNFIAVDMYTYLNTIYPQAVRKALDIVEFVAQGLAQLVGVGSGFVPLETVRLSGHSLGAHIAGMVARRFKVLTGLTMPHITALDPARPCFDSVCSQYALKPSDAVYVDVIHGNNGVYGMKKPIGAADFYPDGTKTFPAGTKTVSEAHFLPVTLFAETIALGNQNNFPAYKCANYVLGGLTGCSSSSSAYMGLQAYKTGIYKVPVNNGSPYGPSAAGQAATWLQNTCHICPT